MSTTEPTITIDDLTLPPDQGEDEPRSYSAKAEQGDVQATIQLRPYRGVHLGYILVEKFYGRRSASGYGRLGYKQEQRGKQLLAVLEQHVREAMLAAGWRVVEQSPAKNDVWVFAGHSQAEPEQQIEQEASQDEHTTVDHRSIYVLSYPRTIHTRPITFACARCRRTVTQQRFPGRKPLYCSETCRAEIEREQSRKRVRKFRADRRTTSEVPAHKA